MNRRSIAIGSLFVVGVNIWESSTVPYLLPDEDPPAADYLGGTATRQAHVLGSNFAYGGTAYMLSEERWR